METKNKEYTYITYDYMVSYNCIKEWEVFNKRKKGKTKINNLLTILGNQK